MSNLPALRRRNEPGNHSAAQRQALILAVIFVAITFATFIVYLILRCIRARGNDSPWFVPPFLRERWKRWSPGGGAYTATPPVPVPSRPPRVRRAPPATGINRESSVRSIMTLPEYRPVAAADRERTIGREGERGGMDVVLEFPETVEEEEERREDHMSTLYEIRLARSVERQNSGVEVQQTTQSTQSLLQTLQVVQEREARLSKVAYAEIGVQRPDGTRVRPSMDSERPLLPEEGSPERRRSEEFFEGRGRSTVSLVRPEGEEGTPDYEGVEWGPPPEYTSPIELRNRGPEGLPVLTVDTGTPVPSRSPSPAPPRRSREEEREEEVEVRPRSLA